MLFNFYIASTKLCQCYANTVFFQGHLLKKILEDMEYLSLWEMQLLAED